MRTRGVALLVTCLAAAGPSAAGAASIPRFGVESELRVGREPLRMVAADFNRDGNPDLANVDFHGGTVSVLLGKGDGRFGRRVGYRVAKEPAGIEAADLNDDGRPDLVVASRVHGSLDSRGYLTVFLNRRGGRFRSAGEYEVNWTDNVAVGDVDEDGTLDLVSDDEGRKLALLLGRGGGRFGRVRRIPSPGWSGGDAALGDLDGDAHLDAVFTGAGSIRVQLGTGDGRFGPVRRYRSGQEPYDVDLADVDEDGDLDAVVANYGEPEEGTNGFVSVLLGAGDGTLLPRTRYPTGSGGSVDAVVVADYDGDGHLDVAASDAAGPVVRRGVGDGTFMAQQRVAGLCTGGGGTAADFDRDGWIDLAFSSYCGAAEYDSFRTVFVLRNRTNEPCEVPDLVSRRLRTARDLLTGAGCTLGAVNRRRSGKARRGTVLAQDPAPGTVLALDSPVDVVVGSR